MRLRSIRIMAVAVVVAAMFDSEMMAGVNQWTRRGPPGGEITALVADPRNPSSIYIVASGNVLKTDDGGTSWRALLNDVRIATLVMPPGQSTTLFAGTGTGAIMRSLDGGLNWATVATRPTWIESIAFDGATVYALAGTSGLRSADNGNTWTEIGSQPSWGTYPTQLAVVDGNLYGLDNSRRLRVSGDGGVSWDGPLHNMQVVAFLVHRSTIVIGGYNGAIRSADLGKTWETLPELPRASQANRRIQFLRHGDSLIGAGDAGVFRFDEESKSWKQIGTELEGNVVSLLVADGARLLAFDATTQFLYGLNAAGSDWSMIDTHLMEGTTTELAIVGSTVFAASSRGLMRLNSGDPSAIWERMAISTSSELSVSAVAASSAGTIIAGTKSGLHKSEDSGATWTLVTSKGAGSEITLSASDVTTMYAALADGLAKSTDGGNSWLSTQSNMPLGYYFWAYGFASWGIEVDRTDSKKVFVSAEEGLYKTVDGGATWQQISRFMAHIAIDRFDPSIVYSTDRGELVRSDDGGATWKPVETSRRNIQAIAVNPAQRLGVYIVTWPGDVFYSSDGGKRWLQMSGRLPSYGISKLAVDDSGRRVFAATDRGVFEYQRNPAAIAGATTHAISLRTVAGNFVSSEECFGGSNARVMANATSAGACESFTLFDVNGGSLQDGDAVYLMTPTDRFVAAEEGGGSACNGCQGPLVADRPAAGAWETFTIRRTTAGSSIANGDSISLQSMTGDYVVAEEGGRNACSCDSVLFANRAARGPWETFNLIIH